MLGAPAPSEGTAAPEYSPPAEFAAHADADKGVTDRIQALVKADRVVLFMKGTPEAPQCGFSATAADLLRTLNVEFTAHDVFADDAVRQGIKTYAEWPTIPQLYVDGAFVGGSDIMVEMNQSGALQELLGVAPVPEVKQVPVTTIKRWLDAETPFVFIDVRTPAEQEIATLGGRLLTRDWLPELEQLPRDQTLVFMCHHGVRSQGAANAFRQLGFTDLNNMVGGIDAWSIEIDDSIPRY